MRSTRTILGLVAQALLVLAVVVALRLGKLPRGVPGEWEWPKLSENSSAGIIDLLLAMFGIAVYAGFAAFVFQVLRTREVHQAVPPKRPKLTEAFWLAGLGIGSILVQFVAMSGAPFGYGLTKWTFALYQPGSSGYYTVAKKQIRDLPAFLAAYPDWIQTQDALHIGTHPPGLFVTSYVSLKAMESRPELAKRVVANLPESVSAGFRELSRKDPLPIADQASIALTGLAILMSCALTVVPLYLLARASLDAPTAWAAATLWPLVPSVILFQPTADTAFPLLATSAIALAAWAVRRPSKTLAGLAGIVLGIGMQFTLAYLPIGLVVALLMISGYSGWKARFLGILAVGVGFVGLTLLAGLLMRANPLAIWWTNQANHARFYVEYPRSYLGWVIANPIETAIAIGLPSVILGVAAVGLDRLRIPRATLSAFAVLLILNFSGRNLSEVARLWIPLMPPLLIAAGIGLGKIGGAGLLFGTICLLGLETLAVQATIQVVYAF